MFRAIYITGKVNFKCAYFNDVKILMIKRLSIILTTIAIVFTIISLVLDFSSVGEHWDRFGENVDWWLLTLIILATTGFGLLFGLFLFRRESYRQRIGFTIPIAFILVNLYPFNKMADYHYGWCEDYNYFTAKRDLKKGKVQLLIAGQLISSDTERTWRAKDSIRNVFGFSLINVGIYSNGLERYNEVMEDYLLERNGENWEERLNAKCDSIDHVYNE